MCAQLLRVLRSGQTLLAAAYSHEPSDAPVDHGERRSDEGEAYDQDLGKGTIGGEGWNASKRCKGKRVRHRLLLTTGRRCAAQGYASALGGTKVTSPLL